MNRLWKYIKEDFWPLYKYYMMVGLHFAAIGALYGVYMIETQTPKTSYTTRADCTHAMEEHDREVRELKARIKELGG